MNFITITRSPDAQSGAPSGDKSSEAGKLNPDATPAATGKVVDPGLSRGAGGKAVGAGLDAGTTDFGPSTAPMNAGRGGAGTNSARTTEVGAHSGAAATDAGAAGSWGPGPGGGSGMTGANGDGVLATGRPTRADSRSAIGGVVPGNDNPNRTLGPIHTGAGTSSGSIGGGLAGTAAPDTLDKPVDLVGSDNPSAPNFAGASRTSQQDTTVPDDPRERWKKETDEARKDERK